LSINFSEDRQGIPFTLRITVIEVGTCQPIPRAAIDIWHCDAIGLYSHFVNASLGGIGGGGRPPPGMNGTRPPGPPGGGNRNTDNTTFLRGNCFLVFISIITYSKSFQVFK